MLQPTALPITFQVFTTSHHWLPFKQHAVLEVQTAQQYTIWQKTFKTHKATSSEHTCHPPLQDFLKEVDIRFMDQLRRGASIVATDLARAAAPASLRECYQLMCLTIPEADQIEASISTLKEEIDMRKAAVADKEALLANHNPPVFQAVQVSIYHCHAGFFLLS